MVYSETDAAEIQLALDDLEKYRKAAFAKYEKFRRITRFFKYTYTPAILIALVSLFLPFLWIITWPFVVIPLALYIVQTLLYTKVFGEPQESFKEKFKTEFMPIALRKMNETFEYSPAGHFSVEEINDMGVFSDEITAFYGEDHIKGKIQGVDVSFSEMQLTTRKLTKGSFAKGLITAGMAISMGELDMEAKKDVLFFNGLVMKADFHKSFTGKVYVIPKSERKRNSIIDFKYASTPKIELGQTDFDQAYNIYATNALLLHYVLTPALAQKILDLGLKLKAPIFLSLIKGQMNLCINWNRNLFEADFARGLPGIQEFNELAKEIGIFEEILVSLSQERRIWGEKAMA